MRERFRFQTSTTKQLSAIYGPVNQDCCDFPDRHSVFVRKHFLLPPLSLPSWPSIARITITYLLIYEYIIPVQFLSRNTFHLVGTTYGMYRWKWWMIGHWSNISPSLSPAILSLSLSLSFSPFRDFVSGWSTKSWWKIFCLLTWTFSNFLPLSPHLPHSFRSKYSWPLILIAKRHLLLLVHFSCFLPNK